MDTAWPLGESPACSSSAKLSWHIQPQGDRCVIITLGDKIDATIGQLCLSLAHTLRVAAIPGVTDVVPSFVAVAVHYRPRGGSNDLNYRQLRERIETVLKRGIAPLSSGGKEIEIPVCYGGEHGPDLEDVARFAAVSPNELIALHSQAPCTVFMLGFAPGHAYVGIHDKRLDMPRRASPRTSVPAGSVAIANRQTSIYPNRLPGGWNIIGATPLRLFDPTREPAALLQPGDTLRFTPISADEFLRLQKEAA